MVLHGKSLERMKDMDDNSVDCVITDPPYAGFDIPKGAEAYCKWFHPYLLEIERICKPQQRIAISQPPRRSKKLQEIFTYQDILRIPEAFNDNRLGGDAFFHLQNPAKDIRSDLTKLQDMQWPKDIVPKSIHPNDRDISKMAIVIQLMSNKGDTVLDPFCGSGAIGVACVLLERKYIGIELMDDRAADAAKRLDAAKLKAERT